MDYPPEEKLWRRIQETVVKRDERPPAICDHKTSALWVVALDRFYCIYLLYTEKIFSNISCLKRPAIFCDIGILPWSGGLYFGILPGGQYFDILPG